MKKEDKNFQNRKRKIHKRTREYKNNVSKAAQSLSIF